jgi:hypothetical protein
MPMLIHRYSSFPSSRTEIALASSSAVTASAKRTRCLRRFALALPGSHSVSIQCTIVHRLWVFGVVVSAESPALRQER